MKESTIQDEEALAGVNIEEPTMDVMHAELERVGNGLSSKCPKCKLGTLLMERCRHSGILYDIDRCVLCGQVFRYTDIEQVRKIGSSTYDDLRPRGTPISGSTSAIDCMKAVKEIADDLRKET